VSSPCGCAADNIARSRGVASQCCGEPRQPWLRRRLMGSPLVDRHRVGWPRLLLTSAGQHFLLDAGTLNVFDYYREYLW
jgi:hypothetical protein